MPSFISVRGDKCIYVVSSLYVLEKPSTLTVCFQGSTGVPLAHWGGFAVQIPSMVGPASWETLLPLELQVEVFSRSFFRHKLWIAESQQEFWFEQIAVAVLHDRAFWEGRLCPLTHKEWCQGIRPPAWTPKAMRLHVWLYVFLLCMTFICHHFS